MEGAVTYREWNAVIQLAGLVVVGGWLLMDAIGGSGTPEVAALGAKLLWAMAALIGFNVVAMVVVTVLVAVIAGETLRDERADERDRAVNARSCRDGYVVTSSAAALALLALALGVDPTFGIYALLVAPMLGGAAESVSRLVHYRIS